MANKNLAQAKNAKNDEFYTQYEDIQKEVNAYLEYNPDVFRDKTVLLPCDDPKWSNFTRFFAQNFERFGIKKLISTSYAPDSKKLKYGTFYGDFFIDDGTPQFDKEKAQTKGRIYILDKDINGDERIDINDLKWGYLEGDGDFNSNEVKELRNEADIIVTNPPFSLFREFISWIMEADKQFLIIGNMNAITYKEVFPLIKENRIWLGNGFNKGNAYFRVCVPREDYANGVYDFENQLVKFRNCCWFTNIDHGRRHQPLQLMTMADNLKHSKHKEIKGKTSYLHYDNYDAIEVPFTDAIPGDYDGIMGVPISFLDKYCPEQFEILGITQRNDDPYKTKKYTKEEYKNANDLNARGVIITNGIPKSIYARILIRKKQ
ncbi:MAG: adenine-specific methyltransferase EcoRI family protein [Bacteroidaceae bacterium]|nr:adenine-specific methyltransferase EcoRI family protein [Bacteroidaceae bacterium]